MRLFEQAPFRLRGTDEADRHADDRRRPPAFFLDQCRASSRAVGALPMASKGRGMPLSGQPDAGGSAGQAGRGRKCRNLGIVQVTLCGHAGDVDADTAKAQQQHLRIGDIGPRPVNTVLIASAKPAL